MWHSVLLLVPLLISPTAAYLPDHDPGYCCYQQFSDHPLFSYASTIMNCMMTPRAIESKVSVVVLFNSSCIYGIRRASMPSFTNLTFVGKGEMRGMRFPAGSLLFIVTNTLKFENIRLASNTTNESTSVEVQGNSDRSIVLTLSFSNCIVVSGISLVSRTNECRVNVQNTELNQIGGAPTMLMFSGSLGVRLEVAVNSTISCTESCTNPVVSAKICSSSQINGVKLVKRGTDVHSPLLLLNQCTSGSSHSAIELQLWNNTFIGEVPNRYDAKWISLRGNDIYGPKVVLQDNDYSQLESTQTGRVYRIYLSKDADMENSKFQVTRSSYRDTPSGWRDDSPLATGVCVDGFNLSYLSYVPIGKENHISLQGSPCNVCCSVDEPPQFGATLAACLRIAANNREKHGGEKVVLLLDDCPAGKYESQISTVKIAAKPRTVGQVTAAITFEEGDYPFVNDDNADHLITFENIIFRKRDGAGDRVATIVLGRERISSKKSDANVKMIGCQVGEGVVVKLKHNVHYNASGTIFTQGQTEHASLSLEAGVNQVVELSDCELVDKFCSTVMNGKMCGNITIKNTLLSKTSVQSCTDAAVDLTSCSTATTLKIEGIKFHGEVANEEEAAWIKVQGSVKNNSKVILFNNDYSGLNDKESTQKGRVYRFRALEVTRQVTLISLQTNWDVNSALATYVCPYNKAPVLPIGRGLIERQIVHDCSRLCCAVTTPHGALATRFQGNSISECLQNLGVNVTRKIVIVFRTCPLGDTIPVAVAEVKKAWSYPGKLKKAVITGKSKKEYRRAQSNGITFKDIRFKAMRKRPKKAESPKIAVSPIKFGTGCACIEGLPNRCYSSLWDAFDGLDQISVNERKQMSAEKTIRIEGVCGSSSSNQSPEVPRLLMEKVKILKKNGSKRPTVVFFASVAVLRVMETLYVGPGVVLQTPNAFDNEQSLNGARASLNHVRIFVGRELLTGKAQGFLKLKRARLHGSITVIVEEAGRLKAIKTRFSGKPRIRTSDRANNKNVTDSIRHKLPPIIYMSRSTFTREFDDTNVNTSMIGISCAIGSKVKMVHCLFPDAKTGAAVEYCYCAGKLDIRFSSFGMGNAANYSLVHVTACNNQTALENHKGTVLLKGISFTDALSSKVISPPRLGAITLNLNPAGPNVLLKDIDYRGFQGRGGLAAVDSKLIFITIHSGYDGEVSHIVKKNYGYMSYKKKNDFGGSLTCVFAPGKAKVTSILPILTKEAFLHGKVRYQCNAEGTVLANGVAVMGGRTVKTTTSPGVHEDNLGEDNLKEDNLDSAAAEDVDRDD